MMKRCENYGRLKQESYQHRCISNRKLSELKKEMRHPKSQRVIEIQSALKTGGCPASELEDATLENLLEKEGILQDEK